MRISFGPSLKDPSRSEWTFATITKEQEQDGDMVSAVALMLFRDPKLSDAKLTEALRAKGYRGKNDKLRRIIERGREVRAESDAAARRANGGKKPKF